MGARSASRAKQTAWTARRRASSSCPTTRPASRACCRASRRTPWRAAGSCNSRSTPWRRSPTSAHRARRCRRATGCCRRSAWHRASASPSPRTSRRASSPSSALIADAVEAGAFPGAPTEKRGDRQFDACRTCDFDVLCPVTRERQWARKSGDPALAPVLALMNAEVPDDLEGAVVDGFDDVRSAAVSAVHDDDKARASHRIRPRLHLGGGGRSGHGEDDRPRGPDRRARAERARHAARDRGDHLHRGGRGRAAPAHPGDDRRRRPPSTPTRTRLVAARQEVDEAAICTLHAFAQRILVEHCVAAGIPPGFDVLDETAERADFDARFERFADSLARRPRRRARPGPGLLDRIDARRPGRDRPGPAPALGPARRRRARAPRAHAHRRPGRGRRPTLDRCSPPSTRRWPWRGGAPTTATSCSSTSATLGAVARHELASCDDEQSTLQFLEGVKSLAQPVRSAGELGRSYRRGARRLRGRGAGAPRRFCVPATTPCSASWEPAWRRFVMAVADERRVEGRLGFHDLLVHARRLLRTRPRRRASRCVAGTGACSSTNSRTPIPSRSSWRPGSPPRWTVQPTWATPSRAGSSWWETPSSRSTGSAGPTSSCSRASAARSANRSCWSRTSARCRASSTFVNTVFDELFGHEPVAGQAAHHALTGERDPLPLRFRGAAAPARHGPPRTRRRVGRGAVAARRARARAEEAAGSAPDAAHDAGQHRGCPPSSCWADR